MNISERINRWRQDAAVMRRWGAEDVAVVLERAAADLEEEMQRTASAVLIHPAAAMEDLPELVEMRAAVALSGYTRGHLRRMLVARTLTNYGSDSRPLLRAAELPRKPGYMPTRPQAREAQ